MDSLQSWFLLLAIFVSSRSPRPRFIVKVCFPLRNFEVQSCTLLYWQYPPRKRFRAAPGYLHLAGPGDSRNESLLSPRLSLTEVKIKCTDSSSGLEWLRSMKLLWATEVYETRLCFAFSANMRISGDVFQTDLSAPPIFYSWPLEERVH
jgi:hypothetical protein